MFAVVTGREQALITGQRLRAANLSYAEIFHSTMDRAAETARIIHQCLANNSIPLRPDDMLVEGGPIPPKPTITYWQLPQKVLLFRSSQSIAKKALIMACITFV